MKDSMTQDYPLLVKVTTTGETLSLGCRIGSFRTNWRQRDVDIYDHPTDKDSVVTVGTGFGGGTNCTAIEPRASYHAAIGTFGKVFP
jgi:hypothetical protein